MLNWDSYGNMAHNYYLYNHPEAGLRRIPWDNNESMSGRPTNKLHRIYIKNIQCMAPHPLHHDDPVYSVRYKTYVEEFAENVFTT